MDKTEIGKLLKQLVEVDGPSGVEEPVAAVVKDVAKDLAHEMRVDAMGRHTIPGASLLPSAGAPQPTRIGGE